MTNVPTQKEIDAFIVFAASNDAEEVEKFVRLYPDHLDASNPADGETALYNAVFWNAEECVTLLLAGKVNIDAMQERNGDLLLGLAVSKENDAIASLLIAAGAKINGQDRQGYTALMFAAWTGNIDMARRLIDLGADVSLVDADGETAIDLARQKENDDMIALLEDAARRRAAAKVSAEETARSAATLEKLKNAPRQSVFNRKLK